MNFPHFTAVFVVSIFMFSACTKKSENKDRQEELIRPAKIVQVTNASGAMTRIYPGTVEAARKSDLAFRVGGQLQLLPALPGRMVKKGELLAAIDESDYRNALSDRQAKYKLAKSQYNQSLSLQQQKYISNADVERAEANLQGAEAALSLAQDNLEHTRLLAPFDGVLAYVKIENYQVVKPNETVIQIRSDDFLDVRFSIPERLLGQVKGNVDPKNICAKVRFNAYPQGEYKACFKEYESTPDRLTRTYSIVHSMPKIEDFAVLPGMAVSVQLDLSQFVAVAKVPGVLVPVEAVFEQDGQEWVWKVTPAMTVEKTPVKVAKAVNGALIIETGLIQGDAIIGAGVMHLRQGVKVKPLVKERGL